MRSRSLDCAEMASLGALGFYHSLHCSHSRYGLPQFVAHRGRVFVRSWWRFYVDSGWGV